VGSANLDNIPLYHTSATQSLTTVVAGTGTELIPDGRATGTVTLANQLFGVVVVPAGTILSTPDGLQFATLQTVNVPSAVQSFSGTTNGQASVAIEAAAGGPASNVAAGRVSQILGRLAGVVLVTNPSGLAGGTARSVLTVTQQDITTATTNALKTLEASELAELNRRYAQSPLRTVLGTTPSVGPETSMVQIGRPYERITVSVTTQMAYLHGDDVRSTGMRMASTDLASSQETLIEGSAQVKVLQAPGTIPAQIGLQVRGQAMPLIDSASLAAQLAGKSVHEALAVLDAQAILHSRRRTARWHATISTDPPLAGRMPVTSRLITVRLVQ
jgi:hypothetical protein